LREFTFGHANHLAAVSRALLVALGQRMALLPGIGERAFIDSDRQNDTPISGGGATLSRATR
jgi:hypothetical protein